MNKKLLTLGFLFTFGIGITNAQLVEDFDTGFPNGWTQNASPITWNHSTTGGNVTPGAMYAFDLGSTNGQGWLQTSWFSTSGITSPQIDFSAVSVRNNFLSPNISLWYDVGNGWVFLDDWGLMWDQNVNNQVFPDILVQDPQTWEPQSSDWHNLTYDASTLGGWFNIRFAWGFEGVNGGALWLDDIRIIEASSSSIAEKPEESLFSLYPNPSNGSVTIQRKKMDGNATMTITDMTGKIVLNKTLVAPTASIDLSETAKGIYLITVTEDDAFSTERLVIQ
jgi:hypothetical protein